MDKLIYFIGRKIVEYFVNNNYIKEKQTSVYQYGVIIAIQSVVIWLSSIIIGTLSNMFIENLIFFITYKVLRKFTGGFHSFRFLICYILSLLLNILFLFFIQYLRVHTYYYLIVLLELFSLIVIIVYAPISNSNKQITKKEFIVYKFISIGLNLILLIVSLILIFYNCPYVFSIAMAISMNGVLMITERIKRRFCKKSIVN